MKKSNNNNSNKWNKIEDRRTERRVNTETEREVAGFIHAKGKEAAQTDTVPYRPGRRSKRSPAPEEHRNVQPESRSTVDTNTVSPRYLQDAVHTPNCPTKFPRHK